MFKGLLKSTSFRLIVLLVFCAVCSGVTWAGPSHSDCYSHIEKIDSKQLDGEERPAKDICLATSVATSSPRYAPSVTPLAIIKDHFPSWHFPSPPAVGRAPPV